MPQSTTIPQNVCEICRYSFTQKSHLTRHLKLHRGEREYECDHCRKRFAQRSNLRTHLKTHLRASAKVRCSILKMSPQNLHHQRTQRQSKLKKATETPGRGKPNYNRKARFPNKSLPARERSQNKLQRDVSNSTRNPRNQIAYLNAAFKSRKDLKKTVNKNDEIQDNEQVSTVAFKRGEKSDQTAPSMLRANGHPTNEFDQAPDWKRLPGAAIQISAGSNAHIACVSTNQDIYALQPDDTWGKLPGKATNVGIGVDGEIWAVNQAGTICRWNMGSWEKTNGTAKSIDVGSVNHVVATQADGDVCLWNSDTGLWEKLDRKALRASIGLDGTLWCVSADNKIFRRDDNKWTHVSGRANRISVGDFDSVYVINPKGQTYRWTGDRWEKQRETLGQIACLQVAGDGTLVRTDADGSIFLKRGCHVGRRVAVYWPLDEEYYPGTLKGYETSGRNKGKYRILYDDGEVEYIPIKDEVIEWIDSDEDDVAIDEQQLPIRCNPPACKPRTAPPPGQAHAAGTDPGGYTIDPKLLESKEEPRKRTHSLNDIHAHCTCSMMKDATGKLISERCDTCKRSWLTDLHIR